MDPGATADPALRRRPISIHTSRRGDDGASREPSALSRPERGATEARQEKGEREEGSMASAPAVEEEQAAAARERDLEAGVPMSPAGRLFRETHFNCYIVAVIGLGAPVDIAAARAGLEATLVRHPRFSSIQVKDDVKKNGKPRWVRTTVNLDDHIIFPYLDPAATSAKPDQAVEDYLSSLSTAPMDHSRPLWELHVLDFPTSEAASAVVVRMHHSLGDGISLLSLLIACTRSAADPARLPELPPAPSRAGPVHAQPRPPLSAGFGALVLWAWLYVVLAWHTLVDVVCFVATAWFLRDRPTPFMAASEGVEFRRKRFVHRTLSLDDVKFVKNAMKCTVNDVLVGVTNAGLSRYYFRKTSDTNNERKKSQKNICVRSALLVNIRKTPGLHALAEMMDSSKDNGAKWGNLIGYILLPFHIAMHDDPLEYIRQGKRTTERKKTSLEAIFTYWSGNLIVKLFGMKAAAALCYGMFTNTTMSFSSMVGPAEKVEFCGHPIVYIAPSVYGHPHALTVHYQSYTNSIKLVLAVDDAQFPDSHQLLDDFAESLRLIRQAASTR
ncbi:O-acyltransferase WSD1 [Dichanthelium oligosanthes]|uniref:O-acyltransferase WSD1 n=1 Tax=Dichanthelium oligosanthes TaxID=888268 RepID=A0A1E5WAU4_9POAL|nr:O-acyltransferase WSD1 [Dichanthelium oligosanthes]